MVRSVCYQTTHNFNDAQDLSQEVFLRAYRKLGVLRNPEKFGRWVVQIARFVCQEWRRTKSRNRLQFVGVTNHPELQSPNETGAAEFPETLLSAISQLPLREQLAVQAYYFQEQSIDKTAEVLGLSKWSAYKILDSARKKLAQIL